MTKATVTATAITFIGMFLKVALLLGPCVGFALYVERHHLHGAQVTAGFGISFLWMLGVTHFLGENNTGHIDS